MVLGVGTGCKELRHFQTDSQKTYIAIAKLGEVTDTLDLTGEVQSVTNPSSITEGQLLEQLGHLRGPQMQDSPAYSARKHKVLL